MQKVASLISLQNVNIPSTAHGWTGNRILSGRHPSCPKIGTGFDQVLPHTRYGGFNFSPKRFAFGAPEVCENNGYAMQNAKFFLAAPEKIPVVPGDILLSASHPINFLPYQYEGYTPEQRQAFRDAQLRMVFFRLDPEFASQAELRKMGIPSCLTK